MWRLSERLGLVPQTATPVLQPSARVVRVALRQTPRECAARMARAMLHTVCVSRCIANDFTPSELHINEIDVVYVAHDDPALKSAIEAVLERVKNEHVGFTVVADVSEQSRDDPTKSLIFEQWRFDVVLDNAPSAASSASSSAAATPASAASAPAVSAVASAAAASAVGAVGAGGGAAASYDREAVRERFIAAMDELTKQLASLERLPSVRPEQDSAPWQVTFSAAPLPSDMLPPPTPVLAAPAPAQLHTLQQLQQQQQHAQQTVQPSATAPPDSAAAPAAAAARQQAAGPTSTSAALPQGADQTPTTRPRKRSILGFFGL